MTLRKFILAASLASATGLFAQWPAYPAKPAASKTADGKPDLSGPTPRTADGKPDLSGIWQYMRPPGEPAPTPPSGPPSKQDNIIPLAVRRSQFWNLGASFKDGLPFTPWAAE